ALAGDAHVAADRLREHVVPALRRVGAVLAERSDRRVDDPGVDRLQILVAEPEALHRPHAEIFGDDVDARHELLEELDPLRGLQLERDAELVAIAILRDGHPLLDAVARALHPERHPLAPSLARL